MIILFVTQFLCDVVSIEFVDSNRLEGSVIASVVASISNVATFIVVVGVSFAFNVVVNGFSVSF